MCMDQLILSSGSAAFVTISGSLHGDKACYWYIHTAIDTIDYVTYVRYVTQSIVSMIQQIIL